MCFDFGRFVFDLVELEKLITHNGDVLMTHSEVFIDDNR